MRILFLLLALGLLRTGMGAPAPAEVDSMSLAQGRAAMWKSAAFNGWGQWHNGEKVKAALFSGTELAILVAALDRQQEWRRWQDRREGAATAELTAYYAQKEDFYLRDRNKLLWWWLWAKLICVLDAYVSGSLSNFDAGWGEEAGLRFEALPPGQGVLGLRVQAPLP